MDGEFQSIETKRVKRQVPPDTTAIIFWLKNRKTDVWRDRREIDHSGEMKQTVVERKDLSNLSVEELKQIESILKNLPTVEDIQRKSRVVITMNMCATYMKGDIRKHRIVNL